MSSAMNSNSPAIARRSKTETVLRWIGAVTAVLTLLFALQKLVQTIGEDNDRQRRVTELRHVSLMQEKAGDYALAWDSIESALKTAEIGGVLAKAMGRVDRRIQEVQVQRQDLAMDWLRNISTSGGQTFSSIVTRILPAVDQGAASASGQRQADLLAHIGWAYFLRSRDGSSNIDPRRSYEAALEIDPANPYAHAFLGHLIAGRGGELQEAQQHFASALAANRERPFVRSMQLAALRNRGAGGDAPFVMIVAEMLESDETIESEVRRYALFNIQRACSGHDAELLQRLRESMGEQLAPTYTALVDSRGGVGPDREGCLARLR
jgi:tetratricopeptide (TPR) repeat protein